MLRILVPTGHGILTCANRSHLGPPAVLSHYNTQFGTLFKLSCLRIGHDHIVLTNNLYYIIIVVVCRPIWLFVHND